MPVVQAQSLSFGEEGDFDLSKFISKGTERAVFRLQQRKTNLIFNDVRLEGSAFTEPEVQTLIEGRTLDAADADEANQVLALSEATDTLINRVLDNEFTLDKGMSDELHGQLAVFEALDAGRFRGEGMVSGGGGAVNAMGLKFQAPDPGERGAALRALYADGLERLQEVQHPALRAMSYSAFAAYNQFYYDGNKRTSRLMMNGELMSHGYDAIVTPNSRKAEYNASLRAMYEYGDASEYIDFLISCYDG